MKSVIAEFTAVPPELIRPYDLTSQQRRAQLKKYGRLSVLHLHKKQQNRRQRVDCICECGRIVTFDWIAVRDGRKKNCGGKNCMWTRLDKEAERMKYEKSTPAIVERLKPKWHCGRPEEACVYSATCNICCCECDKKHCDLRCANNPAHCGGATRRRNENRYTNSSENYFRDAAGKL